MNTALDIRARVYQDTAAKLPLGTRRIFAKLASLHDFAANLALHGRQGERYAEMNPAERVRHDAQTLAAASRQLEHVMSQVYEEPMPELRAANGDMIDIDTSVPDGAKTFTWYAYSGRAIARFSASWTSGAAPMATIQGAARTGTTHSIESGYAYTQSDMRQAAFADIPLDPMLAKEVRHAHQRKHNDVALWGRMDLNLPGLVTHPNITVIDAPLNAGATSRYWSSKTVDEIQRDINTLIDTASEVSFRMRRTTNLWLPTTEFNLIRNTRLGAGDGGMTILGFFKANRPEVTIDELVELRASQSAPEGGSPQLTSNAALALVKNRDIVSFVVPLVFSQLAPQMVGLNIKVFTESMVGGVILKEPPTVVRLDQIGLS